VSLDRDDKLPDDEREIEDVAAESLADYTGMTAEQAREGLRFQSAIQLVLDEVESALGTDIGGMWFDWSDHRGRFKIAVASATDPPVGPRVEAAKKILAAGDVLERTDFIAVRWSLEQLLEAQRCVFKVLEPLARLHKVMTSVSESENLLVIRTADDLTTEQVEVVEAGVRASAVSVRVAPSLGTGYTVIEETLR
jgi:hypothetical protein